MKKTVILLMVCLSATQLFSQILFTYGPYTVGKDEFLRAYNKNKIPVTDKEKSLREYLNLYTKFKLKVKAAQAQQLDTLQQLKYDLQNFRNQVADGYMNDEKGMNTLVDEALERSQKDIHVQHFFVDLNAQSSVADTLKAYQALNELAIALKKGNTKFSDLINELSKKYILIKSNDLGYITALSVPYAIENLVYNLKPGQITAPFRTKSALHLFKNLEERKSIGKWKIAQILLSIPNNPSAVELSAIETKADSIYKLLAAGANFSAIAKNVSEDKLTYMNGGEMVEFSTGKFESSFEINVLALKKDGDISKPFFTTYGYHIIKRLQQRNIPVDKEDETFIINLKQQILQDSRIENARANFLKSILIKTGYKRNELVKDADLFKLADSTIATVQTKKYTVGNKVVFAFKNLNVKVSEWLKFVKDYKFNTDIYKGENNKQLLDKFIATTAFDYYRKQLEEYNPEFKYQMNEFKEGNMLFEIMERNVWNKASNDSVGLHKFYTGNRSIYKWAASANVIIFNCNNAKIASEAIIQFNNGKSWRQISEESEGKIQADSGRYELTQLQLPAGTILKENFISAPYSNSGDSTTSFVKLLQLFPADQSRNFEEAKGLVINNYQTYLEEKWLEALKIKYPVKINEAVFQSLLK